MSVTPLSRVLLGGRTGRNSGEAVTREPDCDRNDRTGRANHGNCRRHVAPAALGLMLLAGCGSGTSTPTPAPTQPSPISIIGIWSGDVSDSSGSGRMQWSLSQTGSSVTGQASASTASGAVTFTAAGTGTLSGTDLTWPTQIRAAGI